jgi:pterin-4a-carbinolamine dehydratase
MKTIFISYRRQDSSISSRWLYESLRLAFGSESVFLDTDSIRAGDDWPEKINQALKSASILIVVIGPTWLRLQDQFGRRRLDLADDWVRGEIRHALEHELTIIPVLVQDAELPAREGLPEDIVGILNSQIINIRENSWQRDRKCLLDVLEAQGLRVKIEDIIYPVPTVHPNALTDAELTSALARLPGWEVVKRPNNRAKTGEAIELHRYYAFHNFEDAIHFMATAARYISRINHHPDWRNVYRTVFIWLSTWNIGHKPSTYDIQLAEYFDSLYSTYKID